MIILIGGNGFVGSGFARYLRAQRMPVTLVDRSNYDLFIGAECDILINANGNSKKFLAKDDAKGEFVASVASVRNSLVDFKFNKYVFLSTSDVYPDCSSPDSSREDAAFNIADQTSYGFHKYLAELCVQHCAKDWLIIRQGGFVGTGMKKNAIFDVLFGEKLWVHPESHFQFIGTEDSARLVMELVNRGLSKQVINLTGKGTISVREIMRIAGRSIPYDLGSKPIRCEISLEKASHHVDLPVTYETVSKFLRHYKQGSALD